jgi:hypothetical protein
VLIDRQFGTARSLRIDPFADPFLYLVGVICDSKSLGVALVMHHFFNLAGSCDPRRAQSSWIGFLVVLFILAIATPARSFPSSRLIYARGRGAEHCPDEGVLRRAVAARLGYDPFFPSAERTIVVVVAAEPPSLKGKVYLLDPAGIAKGLREFTTPSQACDQLLRAVALSISIAIDPASADAHESTPLPDDSPAQPPPTPVDKTARARETTNARSILPGAPLPLRPIDSTARWATGLGASGSIGNAPVGMVGALIFGSLRLGRWSLGLEARAVLPETVLVQGRHIDVFSVEATAAPCLHWQPLFSCLVEDATRFAAAGRDPNAPPSQAGWVLRSGLRGGADLPLFDRFKLRVEADVLATLLHVRITSQEDELWRTPLISGSVAAALAVYF